MINVELENAINDLSNEMNEKDLKNNAKILSDKYRFESGANKIIVRSKNDAYTYVFSRMKATSYAVNFALNETLKNLTCFPKTLIDMGSGTGSAVFATTNLINLDKIDCFERQDEMIDIAKKLLKNNKDYNKIIFHKFDIINDNLDIKSDLVISSYMLNEFDDKNRLISVDKLWNMTNNYLLIVEPGTPNSYKELMEIKNYLKDKGAYIIAPCVCDSCPLINDYCNFTVRLDRSKLQKIAKNGESPFEDEKFFYMAFSKSQIKIDGARVIRHPIFRRKVVDLTLCTKFGIKKLSITKSNKFYKVVRNLTNNDIVDYEKIIKN
jgi:ribosomal protein RSM22 (predicted rRNA methylase)